ncbi:MAG TPA: DUF447 domain-containing protein [Pirellulales bacterium]|nr:DUF447 domain-containing protein [Pirellulales bacterium]
MILEAVVTTLDDDGRVHIAPMGPQVEPEMRRFVLRPFRTATTFYNLKRRGQGVLHVTDDVELIAHAAVGQVDPPPATLPAAAVEGRILADACRWYAFRVRSLDEGQERATVSADVVDRGTIREFFGFNRAKHAVVEAAILATRVRFLPANEIRDDFRRLNVLVEKTAGPAERRAFEFLRSYVNEAIGEV